MEKIPRVLFITNSCISMSTSNGRTLEELFSFIPKDKIAQFYIQNSYPDFNSCINYFRVTDKEMLKCFYSIAGGIIQKSSLKYNIINNAPNIINQKRDAFTLLIRNFLWGLNIWKKTGFDCWVDNYSPELIISMVGDTSFVTNIALNLKRKYKIPLLLINTEGYYFKDYNYFQNSSFIGRILYPLFIYTYKTHFKKLMRSTNFVIYSCDKLSRDYNKIFKVPSQIVFTPSSINISKYEQKTASERIVISYIGNLGLNRHISLIDIAKVLKDYDSNIRLDIYGSCTKKIERDLLAEDNIVYHGSISYEEVISKIDRSDILIHVESFDSFYQKDIKYGFSTKIADSLMSGRCFFMYAPKKIACSEYLESFNPECLATNEVELKNKLIPLIEDTYLRSKYAIIGKEIALKNHSTYSNHKVLSNIISAL